jgi:CPA2 family monovalent cation:H+ antiporter-2
VIKVPRSGSLQISARSALLFDIIYKSTHRSRPALGIAADFVLILVAGLFGGILARAARLPLLVGYVLAGIFVGPYTSGPTVTQIHDIELLAEIGAALLLFSLGLEISFRDLQPVMRIALIGGPIQILLVCIAGAIAAVYGLHLPRTEAIWFGAMISVSSTMVVVKILSAGGVTSTLASRVMIGLLVVQDLAVIPMLIVLPRLSNPDGSGSNLLRSILLSVAMLASIFLLGTRFLPRLLNVLVSWGSRELFLVTVVTTSVGIGYAAYVAGLSFPLGAFVAGIILSSSEFSHQALSDVVPLRDIFGLLFFVTVGMLFNPGFAFQHVVQMMLVVISIFLGKAAIIGVITRLFGYRNMAPWLVGLGLSEIGEFSFVLARTGYSTGALSKTTYDLALGCTVLTMALAPMISSLALPLGRWWRASWTPVLPDTPVDRLDSVPMNHVIVAGYGKTGRVASRALREADVPLVIVELEHRLMAEAGAGGYRAIWGDVTRDEILHAAQIERASMMLLTMPDQSTIHMTIRRAKNLHPALTVIARAAREDQVKELRRVGADVSIQPEFEGGVEMVRQALLRCGHREEENARILDRLRNDLYA